MLPNPSLTFDNFIETQTNKLTLEACTQFAKGSTNTPPVLLLHGPTSSGKTHLLHAIANFVIQEGADKKVIVITSENYTSELVNAIRNKDMAQYRKRFRNLDLLLVDDIHFMAGKESTQEEFFNNFNEVTNNGGQVAFTSAFLPSRLITLEEALKSRLMMGLVLDLSSPSEAEMIHILSRKFSNFPQPIPRNLLQLVSQLAGIDIRHAEGIIKRIAFTYAQIGKYPDSKTVSSWFGEAPLVFLSYTWLDKEAVLAVDQWLRDSGIRVMLDERNFWAGEDLQEQIIRCIRQAGTVVCFYSKNSADRPYPKLERRIAEELERDPNQQEAIGTRVIYFCLDDTVLPVHQQYRLAVMAQEKSFNEACNELLRGITQTAGVPKRVDLSKYYENPPWK